MKESCHPLFILYVGESQDVRKFKLGKIQPIKITDEDIKRSQTPANNLDVTPAV